VRKFPVPSPPEAPKSTAGPGNALGALSVVFAANRPHGRSSIEFLRANRLDCQPPRWRHSWQGIVGTDVPDPLDAYGKVVSSGLSSLRR